MTTDPSIRVIRLEQYHAWAILRANGIEIPVSLPISSIARACPRGRSISVGDTFVLSPQGLRITIAPAGWCHD